MSKRKRTKGAWIFYLSQLYPDLMPDLLKLGRSHKPHNRVTKFRTNAPQAWVVRTWPCEPEDEEKVIEEVARAGIRYGKEVVIVQRTAAEAICDEYFKRKNPTPNKGGTYNE